MHMQMIAIVYFSLDRFMCVVVWAFFGRDAITRFYAAVNHLSIDLERWQHVRVNI